MTSLGRAASGHAASGASPRPPHPAPAPDGRGRVGHVLCQAPRSLPRRARGRAAGGGRVAPGPRPCARPPAHPSPPTRAPPLPGGWQNRILARFALEIGRYNPITAVPAVACPLLLVAASKDTQCPPHLAEKAAAAAKNATLLTLDAGHFDVYQGPIHEQAVKAEAEWLAGVLGA